MTRIVLPHEQTARSDYRFYVLAAIGLILMLGAHALEPGQTPCLERTRPMALHLLVAGVGSVAVAGAVLAWVRNYRFGSEVELDARRLVWWDGCPPLKRHPICLDQVQLIVIDTSSGHRPVRLYAQGGGVHLPPSDCVPWPRAIWADALRAHFPHLRVEMR